MLSLRPCLQNMISLLKNFKLTVTEVDESLNKLGDYTVQGYLHVSVLYQVDEWCRILSEYY